MASYHCNSFVGGTGVDRQFSPAPRIHLSIIVNASLHSWGSSDVYYRLHQS